ncbi:MAG: class I SAM-dependent methyltransferase [Gammaproteobacteria bacterium]|nr:class I SAM-dependent methyltransferase [Gammaproteobacteria bacterium]MCP4090692.1 class I SAM-dependent methyltransferase [Gammaproteobacteria bacterium]MCP4277119.1 class I SAM-dependent methyltransferase [Gammaproteobacteria bacterium]MCP4832675.1 class I SAM-dependent methyltransferase [Gammaproteobacteria bacterium]MCP4928071.1 class I SAM-dependent methyltransferase [Gammaproteobacteria bacterium]
MSAQYDDIAREYQATKESPLRQYVEAFSFFNMLGDVQDKEVLDLACGEGFYTRLIATAGARRVAGVDISAAMISLAKEIEVQQVQGIEYHCADVVSLPDFGCFDLVTAAYLLHYAADTHALQSMCECIVARLKPGGRFVCINENPEQSFADFSGYTQYGFNKSADGPQEDGAKLTYAMVSGRKMIRFDVFYYTRMTYEAALYKAGFSEVRWVPLELAPEGTDACGAEYFQEYMGNPPVAGLVCVL